MDLFQQFDSDDAEYITKNTENNAKCFSWNNDHILIHNDNEKIEKETNDEYYWLVPEQKVEEW